MQRYNKVMKYQRKILRNVLKLKQFNLFAYEWYCKDDDFNIHLQEAPLFDYWNKKREQQAPQKVLCSTNWASESSLWLLKHLNLLPTVMNLLLYPTELNSKFISSKIQYHHIFYYKMVIRWLITISIYVLALGLEPRTPIL